MSAANSPPRHLAGLLCGILAVAVCSPISANWPGRGGPTAAWQVDLGVWADPGRPWTRLWERRHDGGHAELVADEETAYLFVRRGDHEVLEAVDLRSGAVRWTVSDAAPIPEYAAPSYGVGPNSTPALAGEFIVTLGSWGRLQVRRRSDASVVWSRELVEELGGTPLERGLSASPLVQDGLVVLPVGGDSQAVMAFDLRNGDVAWQAHSDIAAYASPRFARIDGVDQIVVLLQNTFVGLAPETGAILWTFGIDSRRYAITSTPVVEGGSFGLVSARDGSRLDVRRERGRWSVDERWSDAAIGSQVANTVRVGDLWVGTRGTSGSNFQTAVDWSSGGVVWRSRDVGNARVIAGPERLLMLSEDGDLLLGVASRDGLDILKREKLLTHRSWTPPSLSSGVLLLRTERTAGGYCACPGTLPRDEPSP